MAWLDRRVQITPVEITGNRMMFNKLCCQAHRFAAHLPDITRTLTPKCAFHRGHLGTQTRQNLTTTAPGGAKAQFVRFKQNNRIAALSKVQCCRAAGNTATNYTDIIALLASLPRAISQPHLSCIAVIRCWAGESHYRASFLACRADRTGGIAGYLIMSPHAPHAVKGGESTVGGACPAKVFDRLQRLKAAD